MWGETWFAIVVVVILLYHQIMYVGILLFKDYYVGQLMDDMIVRSNKLNYNQHCDTYVFETELRKCLSEEHNLTKVFNAMNTIFTDTIIIPLLYDLMVFILLIRYLIVYTQSGMTEFEYVYSIMLCVLIGVAVCCSSAILCTKKLFNLTTKN